jgi:hypothetical protein
MDLLLHDNYSEPAASLWFPLSHLSSIVNSYGEMKKEEDGVEGDGDEPERNAGAKEHDGKKHLIITEEIVL